MTRRRSRTGFLGLAVVSFLVALAWFVLWLVGMSEDGASDPLAGWFRPLAAVVFLALGVSALLAARRLRRAER